MAGVTYSTDGDVGGTYGQGYTDIWVAKMSDNEPFPIELSHHDGTIDKLYTPVQDTIGKDLIAVKFNDIDEYVIDAIEIYMKNKEKVSNEAILYIVGDNNGVPDMDSIIQPKIIKFGGRKK